MLRKLSNVRTVAREIAEAAEGAMGSYRAGHVVDEPSITDRLLGAIEGRLGVRDYPGITWRAKTLRSTKGRGAEEKRHGADFLGVLDLELPTLTVKKGFLAQAKKAEPGILFSTNEWKRLVEQCKVMLSRTPDAFVFAYSKQRGVRIMPANAVLGCTTKDLFTLYDRGVGTFFEEFIECFIGDGRLDSPKIDTLEILKDLSVDRILYLEARGS